MSTDANGLTQMKNENRLLDLAAWRSSVILARVALRRGGGKRRLEGLLAVF